MSSFFDRHRRRVTLGVQGVVTDASGRVLLVKHTYRPGWHFPGGGVERGEAAATALARELREEAYVALTGEPTLFQIYSHFDDFPGDHIALYRVPSWTRTPGSFPTSEIAACRFFDRHTLPPDVVPAVHARLSELFDGAPPAKSW